MNIKKCECGGNILNSTGCGSCWYCDSCKKFGCNNYPTSESTIPSVIILHELDKAELTVNEPDAPNIEAINAARKLITEKLPEVPIYMNREPSGGIIIEYEQGDQTIENVFYNDGTHDFIIFKGNEVVEVKTGNFL